MLCANEDILVVLYTGLVNDEFLPEHYRFNSQDKTRRMEITLNGRRGPSDSTMVVLESGQEPEAIVNLETMSS